MLKKFDVITIGGATQDIMYYTDEAEIIKNKANILKQKLMAFEYGAKIISNDVHITFGGGGMNTAISFANLSLKTATFLNLGRDWIGELILKEIKAKKVKTKYITQNKNTYSGFSFIINHGDQNEHVILGHRGANTELKLNKNQIAKLSTKWIYIASLSGKNNLIKENIKNIFKNKKRIKIAWNPGSTQLKYGYKFFQKYLPQVEVFNLNKDEAIELVLSTGFKTTNINKLLETIYSWGPRIVVITDGHRGAHIYNGEKKYFRKALPNTKNMNTTGAGDAFGSSFVAGLIMYKYDIEKSLKLATYQSNAVIKKIGAQVGLLNKNQIKKL
jgi:sugar/nucleoside kinase (ribokinase family)